MAMRRGILAMNIAIHVFWVTALHAEALPGHTTESDILVVDIELEGAHRTNKDWLQTYLNLNLPERVPVHRLAFYKRKLLTTAVFTGVDIATRPANATNQDEKILVITLNEKWTTIPVIRGAFGGGTPLTVLGVYDTHSFGRLWTLGAETRKYGNAPAGYVAWARAPRWLNGSYVLGFEFWQEYRIRTIYAAGDIAQGSFQTDTKKMRTLFLRPMFGFSDWQIGLDLKYTIDKPWTYKPEEQATDKMPPTQITKAAAVERQARAQLKLIHDNIAIDNIEYDGSRFLVSAGPLFSNLEKQSTTMELELFHYHLLPAHVNLAFHVFGGQSTNHALASQYFLGGLDSVRGVADGAIYGTRALYANFEVRHLTKKWRYAWLQTVGFIDSGAAGSQWQELTRNPRTSLGIGFRLSIPQVYRLALRFDYAWSIDGSGSRGITAGLNELFQPYPPL